MKNFDDLRRERAGFLACILLFTIVFSSFSIAEHAHHDCSGETCPVCKVIFASFAALASFGRLIETEKKNARKLIFVRKKSKICVRKAILFRSEIREERLRL